MFHRSSVAPRLCSVTARPRGFVSLAEEWAWPSVRTPAGRNDSLVSVCPVLDRWPSSGLLFEDCEEKFISREAEGFGRPLGTADLVTELERLVGRPLEGVRPWRSGTRPPRGRVPGKAAITVLDASTRPGLISPPSRYIPPACSSTITIAPFVSPCFVNCPW
jgi:hypothetical protein